jgi:MtN3 and saliva related transmembrane protein
MQTGLIGIVAGALTSVSLLPQLVKMIKEKNGDGISVGTLLVLVSGLSLWVWYGILKEDVPIIVANSFAVFINLWVIVLKMKY